MKWVAPTDTFVEFGGEVGSGDGYPGNPRNKNGIGDGVVYVHAGGDVGASNSWRAGLSYLQTAAKDRDYTQTDVAGNDAQVSFSGRSQVAIADFVWKWAPNGNAQERNFKFQAEYFWRREHGDLTYDSDGALGLTQTGDYRSTPERLLRAGRLPVHAVLARRRALRLARSRHRRLRRERRVPRRLDVQPAARRR